MAPAAKPQPQPPVNGTDERLDLLIEELQALRADLAALLVPRSAPTPTADAAPTAVRLREPAPAPTPAPTGKRK